MSFILYSKVNLKLRSDQDWDRNRGWDRELNLKSRSGSRGWILGWEYGSESGLGSGLEVESRVESCITSRVGSWVRFGGWESSQVSMEVVSLKLEKNIFKIFNSIKHEKNEKYFHSYQTHPMRLLKSFLLWITSKYICLSFVSRLNRSN